MQNRAIHFLRSMRELCFPSRCLSCAKQLDGAAILFCTDCRGKLNFISKPLCLRCGRTFLAGENHYCYVCLDKPWFFTKARAIFIYNDVIAKTIHGLKYGGRKECLETFGQLKKEADPCLDLFQPDIIMPVPLHAKRLRQRGFNQSLLLARIFFPEQKEKIDCDTLIRCLDTTPQTTLRGEERRKNMANAFRVMDLEKVKGKKIMIIDDVFTTGTTVNECSRTLKNAGAREIQVLTLARVREGD